MINSLQRRLEVAGLSDVGRKRTLNEDSFCIDEALGLLLVADGMGGHAAGEVASREAVSALCDFLRHHSLDHKEDTDKTVEWGELEDDDRTWEDLPNPALATIMAAAEHANRIIYALNQERGYPDGQGMGTTIVGLWLQRYLNHAVVFNVGDSRLYRYCAERLQQLTKDHTLYQQWKDYGWSGPPLPPNIILRALGPSPQVKPDVKLQTLSSGDLFLLCSDGLTSMVPDSLIEASLREAETQGLASTCQRLVNLANARGGDDNVTVILARYVGQ